MGQAAKPVRWTWKAAAELSLLLLAVALVSPRCVFRVKVARAESGAVSRLRTIAEEQTAFRQSHDGTFADPLGLLANTLSADHDYSYAVEVVAHNGPLVTQYRVLATSRNPGKTGTRYFSIDELGVVRYKVMHPVTSASPVLQ